MTFAELLTWGSGSQLHLGQPGEPQEGMRPGGVSEPPEPSGPTAHYVGLHFLRLWWSVGSERAASILADCIRRLGRLWDTLNRCSINVCGQLQGAGAPSISLAPGFTEPATSCPGRCTPLPCCTASVDRQLCHVPASLEFLGKLTQDSGQESQVGGLEEELRHREGKVDL